MSNMIAEALEAFKKETRKFQEETRRFELETHEKIVGLEEKNDGLEKKIVGLEEKNDGLEKKIVGLKNFNRVLMSKIDSQYGLLNGNNIRTMERNELLQFQTKMLKASLSKDDYDSLVESSTQEAYDAYKCSETHAFDKAEEDRQAAAAYKAHEEATAALTQAYRDFGGTCETQVMAAYDDSIKAKAALPVEYSADGRDNETVDAMNRLGLYDDLLIKKNDECESCGNTVFAIRVCYCCNVHKSYAARATSLSSRHRL